MSKEVKQRLDELEPRVDELETRMRAAQDKAVQFHAEKDARIEALEAQVTELRALVEDDDDDEEQAEREDVLGDDETPEEPQPAPPANDET